jgi:hypothetical protein
MSSRQPTGLRHSFDYTSSITISSVAWRIFLKDGRKHASLNDITLQLYYLAILVVPASELNRTFEGYTAQIRLRYGLDRTLPWLWYSEVRVMI